MYGGDYIYENKDMGLEKKHGYQNQLTKYLMIVMMIIKVSVDFIII